MPTGSPLGLHRVISDLQVLPQQAWRLDATPELLSDDEVIIDVDTLHLDAASYRQLAEKHTSGSGDLDPGALRDDVRSIIEERGKMQNPVTGSGGMLIGRVAQVGERSTLGLEEGQQVATLVSLSLTPLHITDGLAAWDGRSANVSTSGSAVLFGRSIAAALPDDVEAEVALMVMDVCGAPALVARIVAEYAERAGTAPTVAVLGGAGKSGVLSLAGATKAGASTRIAVVRNHEEAALINDIGVATQVVIADATAVIDVAEAVTKAGGPADITVVCVDVPGCEQGAILSTTDGGTVIFFSMATHFAAAALGAEGLAADVTMLVGNGYTPGHADFALDLLRDNPGVRAVFESRMHTPQNMAT